MKKITAYVYYKSGQRNKFSARVDDADKSVVDLTKIVAECYRDGNNGYIRIGRALIPILATETIVLKSSWF